MIFQITRGLEYRKARSTVHESDAGLMETAIRRRTSDTEAHDRELSPCPRLMKLLPQKSQDSGGCCRDKQRFLGIR